MSFSHLQWTGASTNSEEKHNGAAGKASGRPVGNRDIYLYMVVRANSGGRRAPVGRQLSAGWVPVDITAALRAVPNIARACACNMLYLHEGASPRYFRIAVSTEGPMGPRAIR